MLREGQTDGLNPTLRHRDEFCVKILKCALQSQRRRDREIKIKPGYRIMFNFAVHPTKVGQTMIGEDISRRHAGIALCVLHEPQRRGTDKEEYYAMHTVYTTLTKESH